MTRAVAGARERDMLPFLEKIRAKQAGFTRSERMIAAYLTAHARELPFETAASIARKIGVSQMTVGRFLRSLGYDGLPGLKAELGRLRQVAWLIGDRYERITAAQDGAHGAGGRRNLAQSLDMEVRALVGVYEQARTPRFARVAERIATAGRVYVAGFQTVRGVALDCAQRLEYVRPGVRFLDGANGTYAELFAEGRDPPFLLLVDIHRYSRQAVLLAREAARLGIDLAVVTDTVCYWASDCTEDVFLIQTEVNLFWDSNGPLTSFLNLLVAEVIARIGPAVGERIKELQALQEQFDAFAE
ncbi:MAG TPA: MurR/RpiR family transcriptional regulator [Azospirillaceae bacterium]|nr:MurR/RpiR family transcriptional regulator [Azospirillaceae bacterium]